MKALYGTLRNIYSKFLNFKVFLFDHYPRINGIRSILRQHGYKRLKVVNPSGWKSLPVFSEYYCACDKTGNKVFVKALFNNDYGCARREYNVLKIISDSDDSIKEMIPLPLELIQTNKCNIIITEYVSFPHLLEVTKNEINMDRLLQQINRFLLGMQSLGIIHADIRPKNILWNSQIDKMIIIDFGMASCKRIDKDDIIFGSLILPKELRGTGCGVYNPKEGTFDDAYAMMKTLEEINPDLSEEYPTFYKTLKFHIGKNKVDLYVQ